LATVWAKRASQKIWDPLCILPLKLATSNLVHKLGLGLAYQKRRLGPKFAGVWAGEHTKNWDPLRISATVEDSNFKFGTSLPKNDGYDRNWRGSWLGMHHSIAR